MSSPPCVAVAFSGGRDSTALLHATLRAAREAGVQVLALHVHHNLLPEADAWLDHARALCARWAEEGAPLRFEFVRLHGAPGPGDSVEAWARRERYAALGAMAREAGCELVLLAHHRRDQAETVLLQALRGAGAAGLSAMRPQVVRDGITWGRPWLDRPRESIEAYVREHGLPCVEDPSNADPRFARSRLRSQVWPALAAAFAPAEVALAGSARRLALEVDALTEWAHEDLARASDGPALRLDRWAALSPARRTLVLRAWLQDRQGRGASDTLVDRLVREAAAGTAPARWTADEGEVRRYRGCLRWEPAAALAGDTADVVLRVDTFGLHPAGPWGAVEVRAVGEGGAPLSLLGRLALRPRRGGERFQAAPGAVPRSLKKQYQDAGVAPWQRGGPLVYAGERLVFVPGLGIDARVRAAPGEPQAELHWIPPATPL